jgi:hypothetical protein
MHLNSGLILMSSQKHLGESAGKYRELAQKWTNITSGMDMESHERKELL